MWPLVAILLNMNDPPHNPGDAVDAAPPPAGMIVYALTADGARIAIKRKPNPGGVPVVFFHGMAVNADIWDMPTIAEPDFQYRSLGAVLHESGCDVWLVNLRGHGAPRMYSEPPPGQDDWCVDHSILYDIPAVLAYVVDRTGRRPFAVATSMGAMALAAHLEGSTLIGNGADARIIADYDLALERQRNLAGVVLLEFPAALRWSASLYDEQGRLRWESLFRDGLRRDGGANYPFELLAHWPWLQAMIDASGSVPLDRLRGDPDRPPWWRSLPGPIAGRLERLEKSTASAALQLAGVFSGATHHRAEVLLRGRRYVLDQMKAGVLRQMAKSVRQRGFVSLLGAPDYIYSDGYDCIAEVPVLVMAGGRDRIASADVIREVFFDRIQSADKTFRLWPDVAHGEFTASPYASDLVYPEIQAWIASRAGVPVDR
jgi:pimeloyl-ACP methyl ester carboxylesterase